MSNNVLIDLRFSVREQIVSSKLRKNQFPFIDVFINRLVLIMITLQITKKVKIILPLPGKLVVVNINKRCDHISRNITLLKNEFRRRILLILYIQ